MDIRSRQPYAEAAFNAGHRMRTDAIRPHGVGKPAVKTDAWMSGAGVRLRASEGFNHSPRNGMRWAPMFRGAGRHTEAVSALPDQAGGRVTPMVDARDRQHNSTVGPNDYLKQQVE